ncbi:MAG: hypothetical protein OEY28_02865 [Nitrospira sp.]|nr:hypothetical protein [Nitrospira sp.]
MIVVTDIHASDRTSEDETDYEVAVVHRGKDVRLIFTVSRVVLDDFPITVFRTPVEAYVEFDDYELNNPPPRGRPCGAPDNPVVDKLLEMVRKVHRGERVRLPATISTASVFWRRGWRRWIRRFSFLR